MGRDLGFTESGDNITLYHKRAFDAENRIIADNKGSINPLHLHTYVYNDADDLRSFTDPDGNTFNVYYSEKSKTITDSNNHSIIYEFNHLPGKITRITDALNHITEYLYDDIGRLILIEINGTRIHTYEYDGLDNIVSEIHPETGIISLSYDSANRLSNKSWGGAVLDFSYDTWDRLKKIEVGDGINLDETIDYYYGSRLKEYDQVISSKGWSRNHTIDDFGNVTSETVTIPGLSPKTISYTYDQNNNLARITYPDGNWSEVSNNDLNKPEHLTFNSVNNILVNSASYGPGKTISALMITGNGTQYSATFFPSGKLDDVNLTKSASTIYDASYTYDNHGNVIGLSSTAPSPVMSASFGYDPVNRLTSAAYSIGPISYYTYEYDDYGNMRTVKENGQPIFNKSYDVNNRIISNVYDSRGNLLSEGVHYYNWDKLNRLESVTNLSGELKKYYMYDDKRLRLSAIPALPDIHIKVGLIDILDGGEVIFESPVGGPPVDKAFSVENQGSAILVLAGNPFVSIMGLNADQFSVTQQPTSPILPFCSTSFIVRFEPTSPGMKTAAISISSNDPDEGSYDITLKGNPYPEIDIPQAPDGGMWDFGTVVIPDFVEEVFTIRNTGAVNLILNGNPPIIISGDPYGQFVVVEQPDNLIPPGEETSFVVDFVPLRLGQSYAQLTIVNNDPDENPYNITLRGYGEGSPLNKTDAPALDITSPDGGEKLIVGSFHAISWTGGVNAEYVKIEYSTDNGSTYRTIAERTPNNGLYTWRIPDDVAPACLIRISDSDGMPADLGTLAFGFNLKIDSPLDKIDTEIQLGIRTILPDPNSQVSQVADLIIMLDPKGSTEKVNFNNSELELRDVRLFSSDWHNVQIKLNLGDLSGSLTIDGLTVLERIPLILAPMITDIPEISVFRDPNTPTEVWIDDFEVNCQDENSIFRDFGHIIKPIIRDMFSPYPPGDLPFQGGWIALVDKQNSLGVSEPMIMQSAELISSYDIKVREALIASISEGIYISPQNALKLWPTDIGSIPLVKRIALPESVPYDVSLASFTITSGIADIQPDDSVLISKAPMYGNKTVLPSSSEPMGSTLLTLPNPSLGIFYIYSFDGRLLAEYDRLGNCLKDYLYLGDRLLAEYQPANGQYFYYTPDRLGSTRIVTNSSGTVVYSSAHNSYGGIQYTWLDEFNPTPKYIGKERDEVTDFDYYGARYYQHVSYRWTSPDPVPSNSEYDPQSLNLYAFTNNNPTSSVDVFGFWTYADGRAHDPWFCGFVEWLKKNYPELGAWFSSEGDPSDGIVVSFGYADGDLMKVTSSTKPDGDTSKAEFSLLIDRSIGTDDSDYRIGLAHEAKHIWNYQIYADALRKYDKTDPQAVLQFDLTPYEDERSAYIVSVQVAGALGRDNYIIGRKDWNLMNPNNSFNYRMYDKWWRTQDPFDLRKRLSGADIRR